MWLRHVPTPPMHTVIIIPKVFRKYRVRKWHSKFIFLYCSQHFGNFKPSPRLLKISNFTNPRWRTAAILKTVKSPYLCNRLTDFDEIWHDDAHWPSTADGSLKFWIYANSRCRQPPSWKSQKSRYLRSGLTNLYEIWYADAEWVS